MKHKDYFAGYRALATNGIDKPILNFFRMAGLINGDRLDVQSDAAQTLTAIVNTGVRQNPVIDGLAAQGDNKASLIVWNYRDEDVGGPDANVNVTFSGLPLTCETGPRASIFESTLATATHIVCGDNSALPNTRPQKNTPG